jgi:DUF971 family protein
MASSHHPAALTVERAAKLLRVTWQDGHQSRYALRWLRAHCPCATCREERRAAALETDLLKLSTAPPPSTEIMGAELVGNYAVRFTWTDGHDAGIFTFAALRASCPCPVCHPEGAPPLLPDD